jgi:NADH-ubiquinone oxidoreductase chain 3
MILITVNFAIAQHKPDKNKDAQFECGFISFVQMSRMAFTISFFIYALLFLLFDLEILLVYPYVVTSYNNDIYGLIIMLIFFLLLTIGFFYELGTKALQIDSRQTLENKKIN